MRVSAKKLFVAVFMIMTALPVLAQNKPLVKAEQKLVDLYKGIYGEATKQVSPKQKRQILDSLEPVLEKRLLEVLDLPGSADYPFINLKKNMRLIESADKRLRLFSWNTKLRDTMNYIQVVAQFRDEEGGTHLKVLKPFGQDAKFDTAVDYWEIDALADSSYLVFGDGKYTIQDRAISVVNFKISGDRLIDSTAIFQTESGLSQVLRVDYSIQVCDADEIDVTYDEDAHTLCYPVMMMIVKDKILGHCASGENICLFYDGNIFRKVK